MTLDCQGGGQLTRGSRYVQLCVLRVLLLRDAKAGCDATDGDTIRKL